MESIRRRNVELSQFEKLSALSRLIEQHSDPTLDGHEPEALDVLRWTDLDVDSPPTCDFGPLFFSPCYDVYSGLEAEAHRRRRLWRETLDNSIPDDVEPVQNACYMYPAKRAGWFTGVCFGLSMDHDDEKHPVNAYTTPYLEDLGFPVPDRCDYNELTYITRSVQVPVATDKPHTAIMMLDASVAPEGKMLRSELDAAVTLIREQLRSGRFTDHHTKPVHLDTKLDKLVLRQSRLLDLKGKQPTPDAYILLRWLLNSPVGPTKYEQAEDDALHLGGYESKFAAERPTLVEVESR